MIERLAFDTARLMAEHPPVWRHPNKQVVFDVACRVEDQVRGQLVYGRWSAMALPDQVDPIVAADLAVARDGYFDYEPMSDPAEAMEWHVNFADPHLFTAYASSGLTSTCVEDRLEKQRSGWCQR